MYRRIIAEGLGFINKSNESNYKKPESFHPVEEEEYDELDWSIYMAKLLKIISIKYVDLIGRK